MLFCAAMPLDLSEAVAAKPSERQELLAMVKRCLEVVANQADAITVLNLKVAQLEERVAIAAGQYRQREMSE